MSEQTRESTEKANLFIGHYSFVPSTRAERVSALAALLDEVIAEERERAVKCVRDQLHPDFDGDECCCPFCNDQCEWIVTAIREMGKA